MGDKIGRIHTGKQDLSKLQSRKMKGLKKRGRGEDGDDMATLVDEEEGESPKRSKKE
jgi:ribosome production factor 2